MDSSTALARSEEWDVRQEMLESLGIHLMTYFKVNLPIRNWDSAFSPRWLSLSSESTGDEIAEGATGG